MEAHVSPSSRSDASPAVQEQQRRSPRLSPMAERAGFSQRSGHQARGRGGGGHGRQSTTIQVGLWGRDIVKKRRAPTSHQSDGG
eukprot:627584-Pleurochrysis_carterae.AAC.1